MSSEWTTPEHAPAYLRRADTIPHRAEGEATLLEEVPKDAARILDLGSGDGRLLGLLLLACPAARGVAVEFSPPMLGRLRGRFGGDGRVRVVEHDLEQPLPALGTFDVVASSFAIHHLPHPRKRELYQEAWAVLGPGGVFCNLEHVASPSARLHERFLDALGITPGGRTPPTSCWTWRRSWGGCGRSASRTWTAPGSGGSWPSSSGRGRQGDGARGP
jgi:tRNA (cmo5U34)-methyltransferase